jgi:hypothetical protein
MDGRRFNGCPKYDPEQNRFAPENGGLGVV